MVLTLCSSRTPSVPFERSLSAADFTLFHAAPDVGNAARSAEVAHKPLTEPGGGTKAPTVSVADPLCPSLIAMISTFPAPAVDTWPLLAAVATVLLDVDQVMSRPLSTLPSASFSVAAASVP